MTHKEWTIASILEGYANEVKHLNSIYNEMYDSTDYPDELNIINRWYEASRIGLANKQASFLKLTERLR